MVLLLEKIPKSLRGELTRWLLEVDTGVFVGRVSAVVRDLLWQKVVERAGEGRCAMVHSASNEQGLALRLHGYPDRCLIDFDGLTLISVRTTESERKRRYLESKHSDREDKRSREAHQERPK